MRAPHLRKQKGTSLLLGTASLVFIIPLMGLFIDAGILYAVKSRLQASVDGAALAAARALNLGATTASQATTAKQNAVNWFYANYPPGTWTTTGTQMDTTNVNVFDDATNPNLRNVTVTASTNVPTYFMKFFNVGSTAMTATGNASRRDVVAMLVLDRSGSMCSPGTQPCSSAQSTSACAAMITAAKVFTGQFAANRDRMGMVSFSDGAYVNSAPTTSFQTTLGYTNSSGNAAGSIDSINCNGGTGTATAVSLAYNELYKTNLSGALNFIMLETDGLPNTLAYNWWDGTSFGLNTASNCQDVNGNTKHSTTVGWQTAAQARIWTNSRSMNTGGTGFMSDIPAGTIGSFYTTDPSQTKNFVVLFSPWQSGSSSSSNSITISSSTTAPGAPGCQSFGSQTNYSDFAWLPATDVYGNQVNPSNAYKSITTSGGHIPLTNNVTTDWPNAHGGALNATENSAYRARTNATLPIYFYAIGLSGNAGDPPDPILLQRMANDPTPDEFNSPAAYQPCASETGCITYSAQPQGKFIWAPDASDLGKAFLAISSQILRLSH